MSRLYPFGPTYDFSEANSHFVNKAELDAQFALIRRRSLDFTVALRSLRAPSGALQPDIVTRDSLAPGVFEHIVAGLQPTTGDGGSPDIGGVLDFSKPSNTALLAALAIV